MCVENEMETCLCLGAQICRPTADGKHMCDSKPINRVDNIHALLRGRFSASHKYTEIRDIKALGANNKE